MTKTTYTRETLNNGKWQVAEVNTYDGSKFDQQVRRAETWVQIDKNHGYKTRVTRRSTYWREIARGDNAGTRITIELY